jgi:hypothetical protein
LEVLNKKLLNTPDVCHLCWFFRSQKTLMSSGKFIVETLRHKTYFQKILTSALLSSHYLSSIFFRWFFMIILLDLSSLYYTKLDELTLPITDDRLPIINF